MGGTSNDDQAVKFKIKGLGGFRGQGLVDRPISLLTVSLSKIVNQVLMMTMMKLLFLAGRIRILG